MACLLCRLAAGEIEPAATVEDRGIFPAAVRLATGLSMAELSDRFPDFGRAYEPDGLTIDDFDGYGATVRTLRGFIGSYLDLIGAVRDVVLPNPDLRPA